jgi:hypothetical protein
MQIQVDHKLQATQCAIDFAMPLKLINGSLAQKL